MFKRAITSDDPLKVLGDNLSPFLSDLGRVDSQHISDIRCSLDQEITIGSIVVPKGTISLLRAIAIDPVAMDKILKAISVNHIDIFPLKEAVKYVSGALTRDSDAGDKILKSINKETDIRFFDELSKYIHGREYVAMDREWSRKWNFCMEY